MKKEEILKNVSVCDVTYHVLGQSDRSAMPIGDGELAASVWCTEDGRIHAYLSRTDALSELDRTVKLGEMILDFSPVQFTNECYRQHLSLVDGQIIFTSLEGELHVWIEKRTHSFCVAGSFRRPVEVKTQFRCWRTKPKSPGGEYKDGSGILESADVIEHDDSEVLFYHCNQETIIEDTARVQNLAGAIWAIPDLLSGRIFGGLSHLESSEKHFFLRVVTHSCQGSLETFKSVLRAAQNHALSAEESMAETAAQWNEYWQKSYIFINGDTPASAKIDPKLLPYAKEPQEYFCACPSAVTKAYTLTKYMHACCNNGAMPVLYSGLLFNLCPGLDRNFNTSNFGVVCTAQPIENGIHTDPDERPWLKDQLWQNLRHLYCSLMARGEADRMQVVFNYYRRFWDLNRIRAMQHYGAQGQYNTEITTSFGLQSTEVYGRDRTGLPDGYSANRWGGAVDISPGLELVMLMLDYYEFTNDELFLKEQVLPYFNDLLLFIQTRFPMQKNGKLRIGPINSIETYRNTINPTPIVAGLHSTLSRILSYQADLIEDRAAFLRIQEMLPPIASDTETLLPAEEYVEERFNVEVPELYAIFPFRNYTFYKSDIEIAKKTFEVRTKQYAITESFTIGNTPSAPSCSGWQYTGVVAAMLGLRQEAGRILRENCTLNNPGTRFPAMWGPIYDAVPDADHGANILNQLQAMVMQTDGKRIFIFPAVPLDWDVSFKLYPDSQTCVECSWINGKLAEIDVTPASRKKDVVVVNTV